MADSILNIDAATHLWNDPDTHYLVRSGRVAGIIGFALDQFDARPQADWPGIVDRLRDNLARIDAEHKLWLAERKHNRGLAWGVPPSIDGHKEAAQ